MITIKGALANQLKESPADFSGYKVEVYYSQSIPDPASAKKPPILLPAVKTVVLDQHGNFNIDLGLHQEDSPVSIKIKTPAGEEVAADSALLDGHTLLSLPAHLQIPVMPVFPSKLLNSTLADLLKPFKIKGKAVDLEGKFKISNKQVIFWALPDGAEPDDVFQPILILETDAAGNFSGDRPKGAFNTVVATVSGTNSEELTQAIGVQLNTDGKFKDFIYLVVELPADYAEHEEDCDCHAPSPGRLPDATDLVSNSSVYSQDIGGSCVNMTTPNRALEEFTFSMVVRTTDPEIRGMSLPDVEKSLQEGNMTAISKSVAGRGELGIHNSIDWDNTPTFYQATTIAHGHILFYKQTWKADGYSMGDLLYSLPLAPGQKKEIVTFDWDRTEYTRRDEFTREDEALNSYLGHDRDILDIVNGVVDQNVKGGSKSSTSSTSGGFGASFSNGYIGASGGVSFSSGKSASSAWQDSSRQVSLAGLDQLKDKVMQASSAVRNQRTSVVQSASQAERYRVESEVVANHNHCHAITIEYFEILRHYAVEQKLTDVQECLFIPLQMSPFNNNKILRWRSLLIKHLHLPYGVSRTSFLKAFDAIERIENKYEGNDLPDGTYGSELVQTVSGDLRLTIRLSRPRDEDDDKMDEMLDNPIDLTSLTNQAYRWAGYASLLGYLPAYLPEYPPMDRMYNAVSKIHAQYFLGRKIKEKDKIFEEQIAPRLAEALVNRLQLSSGVGDGGINIPVDFTLVSDYVKDGELQVTIRPTSQWSVYPKTRADMQSVTIYTDSQDILEQSSELTKIIIKSCNLRYTTQHMNGYLCRNSNINNDLKLGDAVTIFTPLSSAEKTDPRKEDLALAMKLRNHLNENLEYYHKVLWMNMDRDRRYMLLDGFEAPNSHGRSVASVVENKVIGLAGNCLIMPVAPGYKLDNTYQDEEGVGLFKHYAPEVAPEPFRISVPTRGVFAEAVQGACNSCEKKDDSRFWHWEEAPNPDEPTTINPVGTDSPAQPIPDLTPQPLTAPIINIQNAPASPDPGSTISGVAQLLGSSNLFNDVTGLAQTQQNAQQAMQANQQAAQHYADMATKLAIQGGNLQNSDKIMGQLEKGFDNKNLTQQEYNGLVKEHLGNLVNGKTIIPQQSQSQDTTTGQQNGTGNTPANTNPENINTGEGNSYYEGEGGMDDPETTNTGTDTGEIPFDNYLPQYEENKGVLPKGKGMFILRVPADDDQSTATIKKIRDNGIEWISICVAEYTKTGTPTLVNANKSRMETLMKNIRVAFGPDFGVWHFGFPRPYINSGNTHKSAENQKAEYQKQVVAFGNLLLKGDHTYNIQGVILDTEDRWKDHTDVYPEDARLLMDYMLSECYRGELSLGMTCYDSIVRRIPVTQISRAHFAIPQIYAYGLQAGRPKTIIDAWKAIGFKYIIPASCAYDRYKPADSNGANGIVHITQALMEELLKNTPVENLAIIWWSWENANSKSFYWDVIKRTTLLSEGTVQINEE